MARRGGRRVGSLAAARAARDRRAHQPRARPSHDLRLAARPRGDDARVPRRRASRRWCGTAPSCSPCAPGAVAFDVPAPRLTPDGSWFTWEGNEVWVPVPGSHNALNAAAALEACGARRRRAGRCAAAPWRSSVPPAGASSAWGRRRPAPRSTTTTRTTRRRCARRSTPPARSSPAGSWPPSSPTCYSRTAALWREFGDALALADLAVVLDVYRAREDAGRLPRGERPAGRRGGGRRRRRAARWPGCRGSTRRSASCAAQLRYGDLLLTLGAGDVDQLGRRLVA